jgi:hypothetical protein
MFCTRLIYEKFSQSNIFSWSCVYCTVCYGAVVIPAFTCHVLGQILADFENFRVKIFWRKILHSFANVFNYLSRIQKNVFKILLSML